MSLLQWHFTAKVDLTNGAGVRSAINFTNGIAKQPFALPCVLISTRPCCQDGGYDWLETHIYESQTSRGEEVKNPWPKRRAVFLQLYFLHFQALDKTLQYNVLLEKTPHGGRLTAPENTDCHKNAHPVLLQRRDLSF